MTTEISSRSGLRAHIASRISMPALIALVAADLAFMAASVWHLMGAETAADRTGPWILETDGGWAEQFGYVQQGALALLLLALCLLTRRGVFLAWGAVYACALADDSLRLHERKGAWLADRLSERLWFPDGLLGLRANDLGEILVWGLLAAVPLTAALVLHRRSDPATRRTSLTLAALLAAYVLVGGVVDQLHVLVMDTAIGDAVGTLEDGGEMIVLSLTLAFAAGAVSAALRSRRSPRSGDETPASEPAAAPAGAPAAP